MRAAVRTAPGRIDIVERPEPTSPQGWVPVRIRAVGICGGDLLYFRDVGPVHAGTTPFIVCHEAVGTTPDGRRVVIDPLLVCDTCEVCRSGTPQYCAQRRDMGYGADGLATETVLVPEHRLIPVPDGVGDAEATVAHPLAAVVHALDRVALGSEGLRPGNRALVLGPGPAGLLFALRLAALGLHVTLAGRPSHRLELAAELGITAQELAALPTRLADVREPFDLVIEATGATELQSQAVVLVRPGGTLLLYSPGTFVLDVNLVFRRELRLVGSSGAPPPTIAEAMRLIAERTVPVGALLTHTFALDEIQGAFEQASAPPEQRGDLVKALVTVGEAP